jgi:hypothetical protein
MRRPASRLTSLFAALLLGSAAGIAVAAGPASAASGVTVVVGSSVSCDANGGTPASGNFRDTGHTLTPVDRQPGFICQVDGVPASASCVNTPPGDAYWGLFWSDGTSGKWVYASQGVGTLKVPAGGWVAFVFQNSTTRTAPSIRPIAASSAPSAKPTAKPTKKPTANPTKKPATKPSSGPTTAGATLTPTLTPTPTTSASTPTPTPSATPATQAPTPTPSATPTTTAPATATPDDVTPAAADDNSDNGSGALGWVAGALVVVLLGGMGAVMWRRKAAGGPS